MLDLTQITDPYRDRPVPSLGAVMARSAAANHSGRSASGRFTRSWLAGAEGDDFPPDSVYWRQQARASMEHLGELLEPYGMNKQVGGLMWPGDAVDRLTWRTMRDMTEAVIAAWETGERDPEKLAEAAHKRLEALLNQGDL